MDTTKTDIRVVSLCTGYGGLDIGLSRVLPACRTILACEIEAYAIANLVQKTEEGGCGDPFPVWSDVKTLPLDVIPEEHEITQFGWPCQPFSLSGKKRADEDPRHIFPFIKNAIRITRPQYIFGENVPGIITAKLSGNYWEDPAGTPVLLHVIRELERIGYQCSWGIFSASEVGLPQERQRVFLLGKRKDAQPLPVAYPESESSQGADHANECREGSENWIQVQPRRSDLRRGTFPARPGEPKSHGELPRICKRGLGRAVNGAGSRLDTFSTERITLLGNGVVPATAALAFSTLYKELTNNEP